MKRAIKCLKCGEEGTVVTTIRYGAYLTVDEFGNAIAVDNGEMPEVDEIAYCYLCDAEYKQRNWSLLVTGEQDEKVKAVDNRIKQVIDAFNSPMFEHDYGEYQKARGEK